MVRIGLGKPLAGRFDTFSPENKHYETALRLERNLVEHVRACVPDLRNGVRAGLSELKTQDVRVIVLTEGDQPRCISLLEHHQIAQFVSDVRSTRKTLEVYRELTTRCVGPAYMVGDQLDVDVQLAKTAGLTSIYFPSDFAPGWTSDLKNDADFTINSYADIPSLLNTSANQ